MNNNKIIGYILVYIKKSTVKIIYTVDFFFKIIYIYKLFYSIILPIKIEGRKLH